MTKLTPGIKRVLFFSTCALALGATKRPASRPWLGGGYCWMINAIIATESPARREFINLQRGP